MLDPARLGLFVAAALILIVTPGPAVLYIVTRSVSQGRLAGLVSTLGIGLGGLCHVLASTVGLTALLQSSATGFAVVRYAGAAYLVFLAFLPQFVDPARGAPGLQMALLGMIFVTPTLCSDGLWALLGAAARSWLAQHDSFLRGQRYVTGSVYLGLGLGTALSGPNRK